MKLLSIAEAADIIRAGGVVAMPTESCYGLACNPLALKAVRRIMKMKRRPANKGVILIADHISRFSRFTMPNKIPHKMMEKMLQTWPGANTWIVPCAPQVSPFLRGDYRSIAIRVTAHKGARELCRRAQTALVSTSANRANRAALRSYAAVFQVFGAELDGVVEGRIGADKRPSRIQDAVTDHILRA